MIQLGKGRLLVQSLSDSDEWEELGAQPAPSSKRKFVNRQSVITGIGEALVNRHARRRFDALARSRRVTTTTTTGIPS
ncbi:MAG: hypothetical protein J7521_20300 [Caulobacter sp.]|nr:hypothetical protein [Caulobacter sp.]